MGRTASAGSSSELQHASTSRLDTLDDPLLGRVLFLAGKPVPWLRRPAAAGAPCCSRSRCCGPPNVHHEIGGVINDELPAQVAGLTRLHALHLSANTFPSDRFGSLAALGSTLQSLCLENNDSLPDCLPQMLALRTLIVKEDNFGLPPEGEALLHAALRVLPHLEQLVLDLVKPPATPLPAGPWQRTLKRLAAPANILQDNLSALGELSCLDQLGMDEDYGEAEDCGYQGEGQHTAVLSVLRWAAEQPVLPWRRLLLKYSTPARL